MLSGNNGRSFAYGHSVLSAVVMVVILAALGTAVLSQEVKEEQPKKPRFEKTGLVLKDNRAGLMWTLNAFPTERQFTWSGAGDGIDRVVNKERYAGFRDWRVPSREELESLVELAKEQGSDAGAGFAALGFQNVQTDAYWSSSENRYFVAEAWAVDMLNGRSSFADKTLYFNLWPVRSAR